MIHAKAYSALMIVAAAVSIVFGCDPVISPPEPEERGVLVGIPWPDSAQRTE